nr:PREDICTED: uncharacterized protein LOC108222565 [Daucus carota subsp. sativus]
MYPICWAVVEGESYASWNWFIRHLLMDLGPEGIMSTGHGWTIISDQQKGLLKSVAELLPNAEHRNCARHIYANFRKKWDGGHYRKLFWAAAKSTTKEEFGRTINKISKHSKQAYAWLIDHDPNVWSRAFFSCVTKCTNIENNMSEVFNGSILSARDKLIIFMLEDIRRAILDRVEKNFPKILKNNADPLCPNIRKKLEDLKAKYRFWTLKHNCEGKFEIFLGNSSGYIVNMREQTCSCNMWQLSGIPCVHAISAIYYGNGNPDDYVDAAYKKETYWKTYTNYMQPLEGSDMWPKSKLVPVLPPMQRRMPGRPKKARRKEMHEDNAKGTSLKANGAVQVSKKGVQMTCSNCGEIGHNKKTCKNSPKKKTLEVEKPKNKGGRPKVQKAASSSILKPKKKNKDVGVGLYTDPKTGKMYLNGYLLPSGGRAEESSSAGMAGPNPPSNENVANNAAIPIQTSEPTDLVPTSPDSSFISQLVELYRTIDTPRTIKTGDINSTSTSRSP